MIGKLTIAQMTEKNTECNYQDVVAEILEKQVDDLFEDFYLSLNEEQVEKYKKFEAVQIVLRNWEIERAYTNGKYEVTKTNI